jgi:hypothetical protein
MSKPDPDRSLKSMNMKWLVLLASLDVVIVLLFVAPEFIKDASWSTVAVMRGLATALLPVIVLLFTGLLSHEVKARLVYWKWANPYPGCEAFSRHGPADARIDMVALKKNVGDLPRDAAEQNKKWFKLYKLVSDDKAVVEAHKLYLMYRDMATMSLPLVVIVPLSLWLGGASPSALWITEFMFAMQFVVCCLGARNSGTRFVCNVLAIHSTKKIPQTARAAPRV